MTPKPENIRALGMTHPEAAGLVGDAGAQSADVVVSQTPVNMPTARYNGVFLHSRRNPPAEAQRGIAEIARNAPPVVIMHGFGLGYQAQALLAATQETLVVAVEPSIDLFRAALWARSLPELLANPRLRLLVAPRTSLLDELLSAHVRQEFQVFRMPNRAETDAEFWHAMEDSERRLQNRLSINRNTVARFGRRWIANLLANVQVLENAVGVHVLSGRFRAIPALVVAAGPTLDTYLTALPALARRMLVVAVDTATTPCRRVGVEPDLCVVVDPQYWNTRHLDRIDTAATVLIAEPATHPTVFRCFAPPHILCSSLFPLGRYLEASVGTLGALGAGGSVSTSAWDLARLMECSAVTVIGLDLGFPAGRTHCGGSFFEEYAVSTATRRAPAETTMGRYRYSGAPYWDRADDGSRILTDRRMAVYQHWFQEQMIRSDAPSTRRLGRAGLRIPGVEHTTVKELLDLPVIRSQLRQRLTDLRNEHAPDPARRSAELRTSLRELDATLSHLEHLGRTALELLDAANRASPGDHGTIDLSALEPVDRQISEAGGTDVVSFLLQDQIHRITQGFGSTSVAEQIQASRELYRGLIESCSFQRDRLRRTL